LDLNKIFTNNQQWVASKLKEDTSYFNKLAKGQQPGILYMGCSDSRVVPELFMGLAPGDIFVHRNVANLVDLGDKSAMMVLQYALEQLKVSHIVVCGHYGCGGVTAAMEDPVIHQPDEWLSPIKNLIKQHRDELDAFEDSYQAQRRLVELNVLRQCANIEQHPLVQKCLQEKQISLQAWVYDVGTGLLTDLKTP
jgi:carbonic anhydrase